MTSIAIHDTFDHLSYRAGVGLLCGSTGSGKTFVTMSLISQQMLAKEGPRWHKILFLSTTADVQPEYFDGIPERDIISDTAAFCETIDNLLAFQKSQFKKGLAQQVLVVFDDVVGSLRGNEGKDFGDAFVRLVTRGRPLMIFTICITHHIKDRVFSNPLVRGNVDFVISARLTGAHLETLAEYMGEGKEKTKMIFKNAWSENYRFLCVDTSNNSKNPESRTSFVKVNPERSPKLIIKYRD